MQHGKYLPNRMAYSISIVYNLSSDVQFKNNMFSEWNTEEFKRNRERLRAVIAALEKCGGVCYNDRRFRRECTAKRKQSTLEISRVGREQDRINE